MPLDAAQAEAGPRSLAVLDLGSGTFRLVVFRYRPGQDYALTDELREPVALGEGLAEGRISPQALERGVKALRAFADFLMGVEEVVTLATSVVREAENGGIVLEEAQSLSLNPRLLPGEEKAALGVLAVANALPLGEALVVDQGAGAPRSPTRRGGPSASAGPCPWGPCGSPRPSCAPTPRPRRRSRPWRPRCAASSRPCPWRGGCPWWA